jgi:hypothetical protein
MMTITTSAADFIRDYLRRLNVPNPVVCLGECANTPVHIGEAVRRDPHNKEVLAMAVKAFEAGPRHLYPLIYPRAHFLWLFTTTQGIRFAPTFFHPPHIRQAMKRGLLDVAEKGLVLKDADGNVVSPRPTPSAL